MLDKLYSINSWTVKSELLTRQFCTKIIFYLNKSRFWGVDKLLSASLNPSKNLFVLTFQPN